MRRQLLSAIPCGAATLLWLDVTSAQSHTASAADRGISADVFKPHLWLSINTRGQIDLTLRKVEMGQRIHAALRRIVAEELGVTATVVRVQQSTSDTAYGNLTTGGSFSVASQWLPLRRVAALARTQLMRAAAIRAGVRESDCIAAEGRVRVGTRFYTYAELVADASALSPIPLDKVTLSAIKSDATAPKKSVDFLYQRSMCDGSARYGIDIKRPNMLYASIERAPAINARVKSFDASEALRVAGVVAVEEIVGNRWPAKDHVRASIAVLATSHWAAQQGRQKLKIVWDRRDASTQNSGDTRARYTKRAQVASSDDLICASVGNLPTSNTQLTRLSAIYSMPYLAHAQLEPLNAVAEVSENFVEVWTGTQRQRRLHDAIVIALKIANDRVRVHTPLIGGAFGRRLEVDYALEAVFLSAKTKRPVQVLWTREDELRAGLFRPASAHRLEAWLDKNGMIHGFSHHIVGESVLSQQEPDKIGLDGSDWTMTITLRTFFYAIDNVLMSHRPMPPELPCAWWRGTGATQTQVATECFMDELARAANIDPIEFRLSHIPAAEKRSFTISQGDTAPYEADYMRQVLTTLAKAPQPSGTVRGVACGFYDCQATYTAVAVNIRMSKGNVQLVRVTVVTDCGRIVDQSSARAQIESNVVFAIGAALYQEVTVKDGEVQARGFHDFRVPRMSEIPSIDVQFIASKRDPSGLGEPATPVVMAAIANAYARLIGHPARYFPLLTAD
jgi:isoquinoline 1-oxidoreductase subunit beta